jgi:hypothetical protein
MTIENVKRAEAVLRRKGKYKEAIDHLIKSGTNPSALIDLNIKTGTDTSGKLIQAPHVSVGVFLHLLVKDCDNELRGLGVEVDDGRESTTTNL